MVKFGIVFKVFKGIVFIIVEGKVWVEFSINWLIFNLEDIVVKLL